MVAVAVRDQPVHPAPVGHAAPAFGDRVAVSPGVSDLRAFQGWLKAVFAFGYFPYEYATISRNYGAGILLTFVFCALFAAQKRKRYLVLSTVLFLLMQTSVFGLLLALAFAAFMAAEAYVDGTLDIRQPAVIAAGVVLGLLRPVA